ncbi:MAG TPA: L,D-transpeptidase family protein [Gaiellaceae bacterium]|nr:L,D-transpeptidase family protein [Gaiellaceae bacterium]
MARRRRTRRSRRGVWIAVALVLVAAGAFAAAVVLLSGASLAGDDTALARVRLQLFAGRVASVRAFAPDGTAIPLVRSNGRLTPRTQLAPGETVSLRVVVRRPGWSAWALGKERHERLTVQTPVAQVVDRWPSTRVIRFDMPVSAVKIGGRSVNATSATVAIPSTKSSGAVNVAVAARPWEKVGAPVRVTWFPKSERPLVLASPAPGAQLDPLEPLRLTYSQRVSLDEHPRLSLRQQGKWVQLDSHTLVFRPGGDGAPFDSDESVRFPRPVEVLGGTTWHVAGASFLRLQQLLAQEGYLPLTWTGDEVAQTKRAEVAAATTPPEGTFSWRYPNTPPELVALWNPGEPDTVTRGAVMMFQHDHELTVDGIAGPDVWHAAIADALAGKHKPGGYSYVYVHRNVPQLLTLWHNGNVVLTSPGNTGVPAAPTALGTWPVFEHIPVGRMSGRNPNGTRYDDPGIRWISYFHGGEALHAFNRASFGTPQSLGCVELPLDQAAKVWPYTPIGTLVTIEN